MAREEALARSKRILGSKKSYNMILVSGTHDSVSYPRFEEVLDRMRETIPNIGVAVLRDDSFYEFILQWTKESAVACAIFAEDEIALALECCYGLVTFTSQEILDRQAYLIEWARKYGLRIKTIKD